MATKGTTPFTFSMKEGFDFVIEEGNNTSINLRKIAWGDSANHKLDLRKWAYQNGEERAMKGVTLSDEGASELACVLVENGYGDTNRLQKAILKRNGETVIEEKPFEDNELEEYYDPKELLG